MVEIGGTCAPAFERVATAFRKNFEVGADVGACVCLYRDGRPVVNLWGGLADRDSGRAWTAETLGWLASSTKGIVTTSFLTLVERGLVDLDAPVGRYWPEFAGHGKEGITVRMLMTQRAGVIVFNRPITYQDQLDHFPIVAEMEKIEPSWVPDTAHGYHAMTYGFLMSELCRRVTGLTIGKFFRQELAGRLGLDLHIGVDKRDVPRIAKLIYPTAEEFQRGLQDAETRDFNLAMGDRNSLLFRATHASTAMTYDDSNNADYYGSEEPTGGGFGTAASLARLYASTIGEVDGVRALNEKTIAMARARISDGVEKVLMFRTAYGVGYALPAGPLWPEQAGNEGAFGFPGANGTLGFADPDHGLAFAYVPNKMQGFIEGKDERVTGLIKAIYASLPG